MGRELSTDPYNVRRRMRRAAKKVRDGAVVLAQVQYKPIEEWDMEELARGRPRDGSSGFSGRIPKWVTSAVVGEAKKRHEALACAEMGAAVQDAIGVIFDLMTDPEVEPRVRLDAAKFIIEHAIGKPTVRVDLDATVSHHEMLLSALVVPDGQGGYMPAHPVEQPAVIDATVIEDDDRDDEGLLIARDPSPPRPRRR
jgi:hypothetical protein